MHAARARFLARGRRRRVAAQHRAATRGTSIGMVYYYFPTKDDLFLAVVEEVYAKLLSDLSRDLAADVAPEQRLRAAVRAHVAARR